LLFFDLRDATGIIQIVGLSKDRINEINLLELQTAVKVHGKVKSRGSKEPSSIEDIEIEATSSVNTLSVASKDTILPFDMGGKELKVELPTLLDNRSVSLRHRSIAPIFKVQEAIVESFRETLKKENFTEIFVPTLVPAATEGGAEVFGVDYYSHKAYLAQSPQLYKQIMVSVFERVFTLAHAYRAEPSVTTRHLSEYVSLDVEFGFINSWEEIVDMAEKVVKGILSGVEERSKNELNQLGVKLPKINGDIPRVKLSEALDILFKRTNVDHRKEPDLDPGDEKELCKWAEEESGSPFVFVTHYPTSKRPFYTMPDKNDSTKTLSFDLLGISEEWFTGGQRIHVYEDLVAAIEKNGGKKEEFGIYLQAFKYGMPPEGGFAIGLERLTKDLLGLANVREASLFPRDMERIDERFSILEKGKNKKR